MLAYHVLAGRNSQQSQRAFRRRNEATPDWDPNSSSHFAVDPSLMNIVDHLLTSDLHCPAEILLLDAHKTARLVFKECINNGENVDRYIFLWL